MSGSAEDVGAWPSWTHGDAAEGVWRHPAYGVLRLDDGGILLHWELHRQLVLKEPAAIVWALCNGGSIDDVVDQVKALGGPVESVRPLTAERVRAIVRSLEERGLVSHEPMSALAGVGSSR